MIEIGIIDDVGEVVTSEESVYCTCREVGHFDAVNYAFSATVSILDSVV